MQERARNDDNAVVFGTLKWVEDVLINKGYYFKDNNHLYSLKSQRPFHTEPFNKENYEQVSKIIEQWIYSMLVEHHGLKLVEIPVNRASGEATSIIFVDKNATKSSKLLILIQGSGKQVTPGIWSRRLLMNDSVETGSQMPYISEAHKKGYDVIITNTNTNSNTDSHGCDTLVRGSEDAHKHFAYVWENFVRPSSYTDISIVAHSYGGVVTMRAVVQSQELRRRVLSVSLTDSVHSPTTITDLSILNWVKTRCQNWVCNDAPLDQKLKLLNGDCPRVSAGTTIHEESSHKSFASVWAFIDRIRQKKIAWMSNYRTIKEKEKASNASEDSFRHSHDTEKRTNKLIEDLTIKSDSSSSNHHQEQAVWSLSNEEDDVSFNDTRAVGYEETGDSACNSDTESDSTVHNQKRMKRSYTNRHSTLFTSSEEDNALLNNTDASINQYMEEINLNTPDKKKPTIENHMKKKMKASGLDEHSEKEMFKPTRENSTTKKMISDDNESSNSSATEETSYVTRKKGTRKILISDDNESSNSSATEEISYVKKASHTEFDSNTYTVHHRKTPLSIPVIDTDIEIEGNCTNVDSTSTQDSDFNMYDEGDSTTDIQLQKDVNEKPVEFGMFDRLLSIAHQLNCYGYSFDNEGVLRETSDMNLIDQSIDSTENDKNIRFLVDEYVEMLLQSRCNIQKVPIHSLDDKTSSIFKSKTFQTDTYTVLLIHGHHPFNVNPRSHSLMLSNSLGSQLPYIQRTHEMGYRVLLMDTSRIIEYTTNETIFEQTGEQFLNVWKSFIEPVKLQKLVIIANGTGHETTLSILLKYKDIRDRVCAIAFTDSNPMKMKFPKYQLGWIKKVCKKWKNSDTPLNKYIAGPGIPTASGGTMVNEEIPSKAFESVWSFINEKISDDMVNAKKQSNTTRNINLLTNVPKANETMDDIKINENTAMLARSTTANDDTSSEKVDHDEFDMTVEDRYPVFSKKDLLEYQEDFPNITVTEITTDFEGSQNDYGWTYQNADLCNVLYTVRKDLTGHQIKLNDLIRSGFPDEYRVETPSQKDFHNPDQINVSIRIDNVKQDGNATRERTENQRTEVHTVQGNSTIPSDKAKLFPKTKLKTLESIYDCITETKVITDLNAKNDEGWLYKNAHLCEVRYKVLNDKEEHSIRLDSLLQREFPNKYKSKTIKAKDLKVHLDKNPNLKLVSIDTDLGMKNEEECKYADTAKCEVSYTVSDDELIRKIRLDHLMDRGFPEKYDNKRVTWSCLEAWARRSARENINIVEFRSDLDSAECEDGWQYNDSEKSFVIYTVGNDSRMKGINLSNLKLRGFPKKHTTFYKYYSFYELQEHFDNLEEIDENQFEVILDTIDKHYRKHTEAVINLELQPYKGPQNFEERLDNEKIYYVGRGKYRFYRYEDMREQLDQNYGRHVRDQFDLDPSTPLVSDDNFTNYLQIIHNNIRRHKGTHHNKFEEYAGPQIPFHRRFKERTKKKVSYNPNRAVNAAEKRKQREKSQREEFIRNINNGSKISESKYSSSAIRCCALCKKYRLIDARAKTKYPLGTYAYKGESKSIHFQCDMLVNTHCQTENDLIVPEKIEIDQMYCVAKETRIEFEFNILVFDRIESGVLKILDHVNGENFKSKKAQTLKVQSYKPLRVSYGSFTNTGRFLTSQEEHERDFSIFFVNNKIKREAVCCQPWIKSEDASSGIYNSTLNIDDLLKLQQCHLFLSHLKVLLCKKCGRSSPGFEDLSSLEFLDKEINEFINNSEILNGKGGSTITLDVLNFQNSDIHKSTELSCEGVCTDCSSYYTVEDGIVKSLAQRIDDDNITSVLDESENIIREESLFGDLNDENIETDYYMSDIDTNMGDSSTIQNLTNDDNQLFNEEMEWSDSQSTLNNGGAYDTDSGHGDVEVEDTYRTFDIDTSYEEGESDGSENWPSDEDPPEPMEDEQVNESTIDYVNVNTWGPENMMSLDVFDDTHCKNFYASLTRMEKMICSPLHLVITIIRCKKNDIPSSKNGSICYPLKRPLITEELPFTDIDKLPFVVVTYSKLDTIHQARVNFENIRRVKFFMERNKICPVYGTKRPYYRMNEKLPFTSNAMNKLQKELESLKLDDDGYVEVRAIRKITDSRLDKRIEKEIKLDELSNWLSSDYKFADAIKSFMVCQREENEEHYEYTSKELWEEMMNEFNADKTADDELPLNLNYLLSFFIRKQWLTINGNDDEYHELLNQIAEELEILSTEYSNDEGSSTISKGDTTVIVSEDPEEIMRQGLKGTFLNNMHFQGPNRDNPAQEFSPNYFALAFPFIFRSGDACPFQTKPIDIKRLDNWKVKYLDWLAMQPDVTTNEEMIFCIYNIKRRLQSWTNSNIIMSQIKANEKTLTRQEIENDPCLRRWCASNLLRLKSNVIDSAPYWRKEKQEILGIKRHLESREEWQPEKEFPIIPHMFDTASVNYNHCPVIHRLLSNKFRNSISDSGNADWMRERLANTLDYPWIISWVGAFMAELDARYFSKVLQQYDYFFSRQEYGVSDK